MIRIMIKIQVKAQPVHWISTHKLIVIKLKLSGIDVTSRLHTSVFLQKIFLLITKFFFPGC